MITLENGEFSHPELHHKGWFKVYRFDTAIEVWLGTKWYALHWGRNLS